MVVAVQAAAAATAVAAETAAELGLCGRGTAQGPASASASASTVGPAWRMGQERRRLLSWAGAAAPSGRTASRPPLQWRAADGGAGAEVATRKIKEIDIDTFDSALESAGGKLVVLDMFTQWCGPCKLMEPKIEAVLDDYSDVVFVKLDCNEKNKPLAKQLGAKTVPTFKLFKQKEVVGEVRGAKFDALLAEIAKHR